jgi:adenylyl cyclase-associated protein
MDINVVPPLSRTDLTGIISRLEAATSRLEDMAASTIELPKINGAPAPAPTGPLPPPPVSRAVPEAPKPIPEAVPESVEDFDSFIAGPVKKYVNLSDEIGGPVAEQVGQMADDNGIGLMRNRLLAFCVLLLGNANSSSLQQRRRRLIWTVQCLCNF